jgi:hypothetical protein
MFDKSIHVLGSLLKATPDKERNSLLKFLSESDAIEIQKKDFSIPKEKPLSIEMIFDKIDESWYFDYLKGLKNEDAKLLISAFPIKKKELLRSKLSINSDLYNLDPNLKTHLLSNFFKEVFENNIPLPTNFLKDSELSFLIDAGSKKVHKLCLYLGLFDLCLELKNVIDASILKKLQIALFPDEVEFLRSLIDYRNIHSFGLMGLQNWNLDVDSLRQTIFERGLFRLGIALKDSHEDFLWYVYHSLSKNLKSNLEKITKNPADERILNIMLEQTLMAWKGVCTALN